jgi:hypothetical protein
MRKRNMERKLEKNKNEKSEINERRKDQIQMKEEGRQNINRGRRKS